MFITADLTRQRCAYLRIAPLTIRSEIVEMARSNLPRTGVFSMDSAAARCHDNCVIMAATVERSSMRRRQSAERCLRIRCTPARWLAQVGCCVRAVVTMMVDGVDHRRFSSWRLAAREERAGEDAGQKITRGACQRSSSIFYGRSFNS